MPVPKRACRYCRGEYGVKGIGRHESVCPRRQAEAAQGEAYSDALKQTQVHQLLADFMAKHEKPVQTKKDADASAAQSIVEDASEPTATFSCDVPASNDANVSAPAAIADSEAKPQIDDIKRVFHPHSERPPIVQNLYDYRASQAPPTRRQPTGQKPWEPFRTRLDFEVAEFTLDAMLNAGQVETLISIIRRCAENISDLTIRSSRDLEKEWRHVSKTCTEFEHSEVPVEYRKQQHVFEMYFKPLWNWTLDIVRDPHLAEFFVWDAEKAYRYNGSKYVRFFSEPWTANTWWEIQSKLPQCSNAKVCPYIIYADKAKLSSFGTQKGYPIIARLANVVVSLRNGVEWGGGQIVGWLPVVTEDAAESGKADYVNFKNAVWHKSFYKLLESIVLPSKIGILVQCGDGIERRLYPVVLILAADYEEACIMTLIRGLNALYPCPICYVKKDEQSDVTQSADLRTQQISQQVLKQARELRTKEERENLLKQHGLRNIDNVFWNVAYSDPYQASSFDRLHAYALGLWGTHLFEQLKKHVTELGNRSDSIINQQFAALPRWRNLNRFESVMNVSFNDGSKHDDISKMIILASHNVLVRPIDVLFLRCIRSYQEVNMYISKELHTSESITKGRQKLLEFDENMKTYIEQVPETDLEKSWDFPKMHSHKHAFDNIEQKGVSKNFGTKIDESMHGAVRRTYLLQTNFKDVAPQILKFDHRTVVCRRIRDQVNDLDEIKHAQEKEKEKGKGKEKEIPEDLEVMGNIELGSRLSPQTLKTLEEDRQKDPDFRRFRFKLAGFLSKFLPNYGHPLPENGWIKLHPDDTVIAYQFLKVFYQSVDDWSDKTDFLRCNPSFHGVARFDGALVKTATGEIFVKLVYIFKVSVAEKEYAFALVRPLDAPRGRVSTRDKELKLFRVRAKPESEFIPVESIIRGALLAPAFDKEDEYLVSDMVDLDMHFRLEDKLAILCSS